MSEVTGALAGAEVVLADGGALWELHEASVTTADAAQTTSAADECMRKKFTVVTLHPVSRQAESGSWRLSA
jgi:hypothetical protein